MLMYAVSAVSDALLCYSIGIFAGPVRQRFGLLPVVFIFLGVAFDLLGTFLMSLLSPGFAVDLHTVIGMIALVMMIILAVWSLVEYRRGFREKSIRRRGYALIAWLTWAAVFVLGAVGR